MSLINALLPRQHDSTGMSAGVWISRRSRVSHSAKPPVMKLAAPDEALHYSQMCNFTKLWPNLLTVTSHVLLKPHMGLKLKKGKFHPQQVVVCVCARVVQTCENDSCSLCRSNFSLYTSDLATVANQRQKKSLFVAVITLQAPLKSTWQTDS